MLDFLYTAVSWVLLRWHQLFTFLGLDPTGGLNWSLSIVFLVVTARLLLFRLFVKQVHYQRHMQEMQPKLAAVKEKYKSDKAEMQRQMMKLQQENGFNPLTGCLPMFLQIPIFISLFHVLRHVANSNTRCGAGSNYHGKLLTLYTFTKKDTCSVADAKLFGAPLAASLHDSADKIIQLGGDTSATRVVTLVLVLISAAATLVTQRMAMSRMVTVPTGTSATVQKLMQVFIPVSVLFSGFIFPLGVLLYWFTSNVWTMLQQAYINRYHPHVPKEVVETGTVGATARPKVGQRPVRDPRGRATLTKDARNVQDADGAEVSMTKSGSTKSGTTSSNDSGPEPSAPRLTTPRPGQRPNRPNGNRPPGKRKRR